MSKVIEKKNSLKLLYFIIASDGVVKDDELGKFDEIGTEVDGEVFYSYKDELIKECDDVRNKGLDGIKEACLEILNTDGVSLAEGMVPRLLLWNMLAVAYSDEDYSSEEKELITYTAQILKEDESILLEMEQYIQTVYSVEKTIEKFSESNRPYSEIKPLADQAEIRRNNIMSAARALIEDEVIIDDPEIIEKANIIASTGEKIAEISSAIGTPIIETGKKIGQAVVPVAEGVKEGAGKLFGKVRDKIFK